MFQLIDNQNLPKEGDEMVIKQLSVFVENKPGRLAEITKILEAANVDIRAFSLADTSDFGILRLIVSNPDAAVQALSSSDMAVSLTSVLAVEIDDKPGGLYRVLSIFSEAGITVEYAYAFVTRRDTDAFVILRVEDIDASIKLLNENNIRLLKAEQVYSI